MTWTYTQPTGDPVVWADVKDHVRFLIGDRVQSSWSPSDEEVNAAIASWNAAYPEHEDHPQGIAAVVALAVGDWIDTDGVMSESKSVGNSSLSRTYRDRVKAWRRLAMRLAGLSPVPVPGASMSGFGLAAGSATPNRLFTIGQFDNPPTRVIDG